MTTIKTAFFIAAHKNPDQVVEIAASVSGEQSIVAVHCDRKAGRLFQEQIRARLQERGINNVLFLKRRTVTWGAKTLMELTFDAIDTLLTWNDDWTSFVNLSGQCLPTKPLVELNAFLSRQPGRNFMECLDPEREWQWVDYRLNRYHAEVLGTVRNLQVPRAKPSGFKVYGGSSWVFLDRKFCEYVVRAPAATPIKQYFKYVQIPDEMVFQTLIKNSPFADSLIANNHRLIIWPEPTSPHPAILTLRDLPAISSGDHFFARKFDEAVDPDVIRQTLNLAPVTNAPAHHSNRKSVRGAANMGGAENSAQAGTGSQHAKQPPTSLTA